MGAVRKLTIHEEEKIFLDSLKFTLKSKYESLRAFAEKKLFVYQRGEILKSGVRVKRFQDLKAPMPRKGDKVSVIYTGYRADGKVFDEGTITFTLGKREVITAWDKALVLVKEGQEATLICPSSSAYGKYGAGKLIPPYTTLIFDIILEKIN